VASGSEKNSRARREYRPTVEGLEALRLLSSATQAHPLAGVAAEHDLRTDPARHHAAPLGDDAPAVSSATWDAALVQTELSQILGAPGTAAPAAPTSAATVAKAIASGLTQLNKYLSRAWYRAGIPAQLHDDSSQAVYATLLEHLGRNRFDSLIADIGHWSIKDVLSRETAEGMDFFRAVDMVKKRTQRERVHQSLDSVDVPSSSREEAKSASLREALQEAIHHTLSPREAALIQDTLMGKTPAEIAVGWGVAAKTVSNEKTRVLQKLRDALMDHEMN
jgi:RNA polymerase sigma factor (sigma-70 family)